MRVPLKVRMHALRAYVGCRWRLVLVEWGTLVFMVLVATGLAGGAFKFWGSIYGLQACEKQVTKERTVDEAITAALRRLGQVSNVTEDGRTLYGVSWTEVADRAIRWWDRTGRHVSRNPEFKDPDVGFASGITRGLEFQYLSRDEALRVVRAYEQETVRPEFRDEITGWFEQRFPELLGDPALTEWLGADLVQMYADGFIKPGDISARAQTQH